MEGRGAPRRVVVAGAAARAEQRVARDTNYFQEVGSAWGEDDIEIWLVGPEVSSAGIGRPRSGARVNPIVRCHRGTLSSLFGEQGGLSDVSPGDIDLYVCFNAGFGAFLQSQKVDLLLSWVDDLYLIRDSGAPAVFTCANDYDDVKGEVLVMSQLLGAHFEMMPRENPFGMATTLMAEGVTAADVEAGSTGWSRGNAFWYAIRGAEEPRRQRLAPGPNHERLMAIREALMGADVPPAVAVEEDVAQSDQPDEEENVLAKEADLTPLAPSPDSEGTSGAEVPICFSLDHTEDRRSFLLVAALPDVGSMEEVTLDVSPSAVRLEVPGRPVLNVSMPSMIDLSRTAAKFSKKRAELELTLPIQE